MGRRACSVLLAVVICLTALPQAALAISLPTLIPVANPDAYTASSDAGAPALAPSAPGVLANDSGSALTAVLVTPPAHAASFSLHSDGSFSYTPTLNFVGSDSFAYKANNGHADSVAATVTITVAHGNLPPVLTVPGAQNAVQGVALTFSTANTNAISVTDPDAGTNAIVVTLGATHGVITVGTAGVTVTGNGTGSVQVTGPQAAITAALNGMTYTAAGAYTGPDTLTIHADDQGNSGAGGAKTADASVAITVTGLPAVTSTTPANNAINVLASTTISITFSKAVNVTGTAFTLECPVGTPQTFTLAPAPPGGATTFTLTPNVALPAGVVCTVTVVAAQVTAVGNGAHPAADFVFSFTVDTPPTVSSTTPTNGATGVLGSAPVTVVFSKAVNVTASAFKLECPAGTPQAFTLAPPPPGGATTFTLTPNASLPAGVVCTVTAVAAQITDLAGTHLTADVVFTFTVDTAPVVSGTTPTNGATTVALNSTVSVTFDKAVNVTATAFKLECPAGTPQAFTLAPAPPGGATSFTLTPSALLPAGVVCTVTAVAAQISDLTGTHLASDYVFTFSTDTAPTVSSTTPTNGATNIAPSTTVTVNFSKQVNATTSSFTLECPAGTPETFTVTPSQGPSSSYVLHPTSNLPVATQCTVTVVAAQVTDVAGTAMATNNVFTFTTGTPPSVTSTSPTNGATAVLASTTVTVNFSASVNVTGTSFKLECPAGTPQAFTVTPASPAASYVLHPTSNLPAGVTCTVTAVAAQIADAVTGINMATDYVFTFSTDTPPTVTSTTPTNGATNVVLTSTVSFTFNTAVNVTASAFKLECPAGTPVAFTLTPAPPGGATTFTLTPSANLPAGVTCTVTAVAAQIADLAGTHLASDFVFTFSTDTPPTVSSTTPSNGAANVLASTTVSFTFNKAVNVTASAFTLECPVGTPVAFTLTPAPPGGATTFTLTPSANLPAGVTCTATAVANQITDLVGTPMAANFPFTFTIDTPPTVTSTTPTNGATGVLVTSTVSVTFNKAVNVTASAFKLECPVGTPVAFTVAPVPPGGVTTFTLTPSANLPADTVCTATVVASQVADVPGTLMTTDVAFSFATPPLAVDDTYAETLIGNVSINSAVISFSVTTNDIFNNPVTITAFDATSANGGTVNMTTSGAGIGQFTFNPAAGYTGADTFTYTISNAHGSTTATVHLTISGIIWFIDNNAGAGDGRLSSPFNTLAAFQAINDGGAGHHPAANANIFLYDSATGYTGPVTLLNGQKLIGQDATSSLSTITGLTPGTSSAALPSTGGGSPNKVSITSSGNTVTLGSGNTVWGMTLGNATGTALTGASVGSFKVRDMTVNTTGAAISLANGALDVILTKVSAGGGTHGIALTTTTGSFDVEGDGASDPANTTQGRTTAKNGGGTLTLGSGGTIQSATSAGVLLSSATNVTLRNVTIQNNGSGINTGGDGITATNGSALMLDNVLITGQGGNFGLHATGVAGITLQHTEASANATTAGVETSHVWNVRFDSVTGTATFGNSLFFNSRENVIGVVNTGSSTLSLTATNVFIHDTAAANPGNDCLSLEADNSANLSLDLEGSTVNNCRNIGVNLNVNNTAGGGTYTIKSTHFDGNGGNNLGGADINVAHNGAGTTMSFDIENNTTRQNFVSGSGVSISVDLGGQSTATTVLQGKILNNVVGKASVTDSGSVNGAGIALQGNGAGTLTALISGNTVVQAVEGLLVLSSGTTDTMNMTINGGNDFEVSNTNVNGFLGVELTAGGSAGSDMICANVTGNSKFIGSVSQGSNGIQTEVLGTSTINLQGYSGGSNDAVAITSFLSTTATTVNPGPNVVLAGGTIKTAPSPCPTPP